ncbi:YciI family protein [Mesorhizobium sp. 1M-11]|uniref:YciI family protein n=1 Tax=Mesorhizobium sp. 1M-11 TaxID=1529006 RepID=UPI0006C76EDB|nr:YciI family protein [Mesorhizobium sp. 1M-11]
MHYSLLFYQTPEVFSARADPEKRKAFHAAFIPYVKAMHDAGIIVAGAGLEKPDAATSIRLGDSGHHVQDGPYADTKEQLAGFFIIDVPDLDAALKWASRYPAEPGFGVEVRPNLPEDRETLLKTMADG